jgi:hypothetical protein
MEVVMTTKEFTELLKDAPLASGGDTVSLVGMLARSGDPGKFVLHLADGSSHTIDVAAVRKHSVLGQSVGHAIVQVDVDKDKAPVVEGLPHPPFPKPIWDPKLPIVDGKHPPFDKAFLDPKVPWLDKNPLADIPRKYIGSDGPLGTLVEGVQWGGGNVVDPGPAQAAAGAMPFSLAMGHQVGGQQLDALQTVSLAGVRTYINGYNWTADHPHMYRLM